MLTVEFQRIDQPVKLGRFSHSLNDLVPLPKDSEPAVPDMTHLFPERAARAAEQCQVLPPLPATAIQLLQLAGDPTADAAKLARVIRQDGPTTAKLLSYANSSLYGRAVTINDVKDAVARVLGFDIAMGIAIGMTLGQTLRIPEDGTLGLTAYQRDAVYSAALAEKLTRHIPGHLGVSSGKAYLAGLLHNIGFLFLGHSFPEQYQRLAKTRAVNPHLPVKTLEYAVLDTGHEVLGGRLLSGWGLPGEVVAAALHHHDQDYQGDHAAYVHLIGLTAYLLNDHGLAELGQDADLPQASLTYFGLSVEQVSETTEALLEHREALDQLVRMVA
jgi:HD-like signal output (HDOD) protein